MKKSKDGYYRKDLSVTRNDGTKKRIALRARTQKELEEMIYKTRWEIDNGLFCINKNTPFKIWAEEWLKVYKEGNIHPKSVANYKGILKNNIYPYIGDMSLNRIKKTNCQKILNNYEHLSSSYVSKIRMTLYQIFEAAIDDDYILKNPAKHLQIPKQCTYTPRRSITSDERKHILTLCESHRAGLMVLTELYCGLRPSEARRLMWGDVDLDNMTITIKKSKTSAGVRVVPIPENLIDRFKSEPKTSLYVFHTEANTPLTEASQRRMWDNFKRELDIQMGAEVYRNKIVVSKLATDFTQYCLRHTYATDLQLAGVPINVAKVLLGHSDINTTGNIYTHYVDATQKQAITAINNYIQKSS